MLGVFLLGTDRNIRPTERAIKSQNCLEILND